MFETIGILLTIFFWAAALLGFFGGIFLCFMNLKEGSAGDKIQAAIAVILGIIAFVYVYSWFESILWCMIISGVVFCSLGNPAENYDKNGKWKQPENPQPSAGKIIIDEIIQYERDKEVVKNALREYENER